TFLCTRPEQSDSWRSKIFLKRSIFSFRLGTYSKAVGRTELSASTLSFPHDRGAFLCRLSVSRWVGGINVDLKTPRNSAARLTRSTPNQFASPPSGRWIRMTSGILSRRVRRNSARLSRNRCTHLHRRPV